MIYIEIKNVFERLVLRRDVDVEIESVVGDSGRTFLFDVFDASVRAERAFDVTSAVPRIAAGF